MPIARQSAEHEMINLAAAFYVMNWLAAADEAMAAAGVFLSNGAARGWLPGWEYPTMPARGR